MMDGPELSRLAGLAGCLARPVAAGWLGLHVAEAVILMAAFRADLDGLDPVAVARDLQHSIRSAAGA